MNNITQEISENLFSINENIPYVLIHSGITSYLIILFLTFFSIYIPYKCLIFLFKKYNGIFDVAVRVILILISLFIAFLFYIFSSYHIENQEKNITNKIFNSIERIDDTLYLSEKLQKKNKITIHKDDIKNISITPTIRSKSNRAGMKEKEEEYICIINITLKDDTNMQLLVHEERMRLLNLPRCSHIKQ